MRNRYIIIFLLVLAISFSFLACGKKTGEDRIKQGSKATEETQNYESKETKLEKHLPQPDFGTFKTSYYEYNDELDASLKGCSKSDCEEYVALCKEKGFVIDAEEDEGEYSAFDSEGYKIEIDYYSDYLSVDLYYPMELTSIKWPKSKLAESIPKLDTSAGKIEYDSSEGFEMYIGNVSLDDFYNYVEECMDAGFSFKYYYDREDKEFEGYNEIGYVLDLEYIGGNIISIYAATKSIYADETEGTEAPTNETELLTEETVEETTEQNVAKSTNEATGIRPEIKEAIDSYESFIDEYCTFMESYNAADLSQATKYIELISKEIEMAKKFDAIEEDDLTDEEALYYSEVSLRCSQKLYSISN